jgi:AcrR family transcriptional regulator
VDPHTDPRILRTRAALREALGSLLTERTFEKLTLHEIAEEAGLNRATIYKHYADKFALLDAWVADDLLQRFFAAKSGAELTNELMLAAFISATCECLEWVNTLGHPDDRLLHPFADARFRALVLRVIEYSLAEKALLAVVKPELAAPMASGAIFGAATAWAKTCHSSSRTNSSPPVLSAHVASAIRGLDQLLVPNPKRVRFTRPLTFE